MKKFVLIFLVKRDFNKYLMNEYNKKFILYCMQKGDVT